jgi:threo-3-hydroxy-L-aspartate ammonia-lyase
VTGGDLVGIEAVHAAHERIRPHVVRTPLVPMDSAGVVLKAESLQPSGSFKLRGAFNTLLQLTPDERRRGVVAHSSGNHAIAVAYAGAALGIRTVVVMPHDAPRVKIERTGSLGADIVLTGPSSAERVGRARELVAAEGYRLVEPYDSETVVAATGTIAVEALEDHAGGAAGVSALYVPISGGGLSAGVATAAKALAPWLRVVGVEPDVAADALASRRAGRVVELSGEQMARTAADGLRVQKVGAVPWPHIEAFVDEIVTVTEAEIRAAMVAVAREARLVAEPSGATPVAAAMAGLGAADSAPPSRIAVLTGGNVDTALYATVLAESEAPR